MPLICIFEGIHIYLFYRLGEHEPPHIHAFYQDKEMKINIIDLSIMKCKVPPKIKKKIIEWTTFHQNELIEIWTTQVFKKLSPNY